MNQARTAESTYRHLGAYNVYYVKLNPSFIQNFLIIWKILIYMYQR